MINSKNDNRNGSKKAGFPLISSVVSLDHAFLSGFFLGQLTVDVKDNVVGFDVPMDVVQIAVDVVDGLFSSSAIQPFSPLEVSPQVSSKKDHFPSLNLFIPGGLKMSSKDFFRM